jgi:hypothetical protein
MEESLSESLLLAGATSYNFLALEHLMSAYKRVYDMTRETLTSELIGSTILTTSERIATDTEQWQCDVSDTLSHRLMVCSHNYKGRIDRFFHCTPISIHIYLNCSRCNGVQPQLQRQVQMIVLVIYA